MSRICADSHRISVIIWTDINHAKLRYGLRIDIVVTDKSHLQEIGFIIFFFILFRYLNTSCNVRLFGKGVLCFFHALYHCHIFFEGSQHMIFVHSSPFIHFSKGKCTSSKFKNVFSTMISSSGDRYFVSMLSFLKFDNYTTYVRGSTPATVPPTWHLIRKRQKKTKTRTF